MSILCQRSKMISVTKMLSSLKADYFFIILAIFFSKVVSDSDDKNTFAEDNITDRREFSISDSFTTSNVYSDDLKPDKYSIPHNDENDSSHIALGNLVTRKLEFGLLKAKCAFYSHGKEVNLDKISDVWQVVYYKLDKDIKCFKIFIKKTTDEEKTACSEKYGTFSGKVNWTLCDLEIRASEKGDTQRRHFLQRGVRGIMNNVIVVERIVEKGRIYSLNQENPDQWLVVDDLLLMRDCSDGNMVVFSRFPHQARRREISDALATFGENVMDGKMCK